MPHVTLIRSDELAATPGYAYASSVAPGSRLIHLAGACPLNADGSTADPGDYAGQARKCVENLERALRSAGATLAEVAYTRVLVASALRDDLGAVWDVVRAAFAGHEAPSTLFGVTVLGYENQLVEIEAVAAVAE